jgi:hypothetical protein
VGTTSDAAEAYTGDIIVPVRLLIDLFDELEAEINAAIWERFDIKEPDIDLVAAADKAVLVTEVNTLFHKRPNYSWLDAVMPADVPISNWYYGPAERYFFAVCQSLTNS